MAFKRIAGTIQIKMKKTLKSEIHSRNYFSIMHTTRSDEKMRLMTSHGNSIQEEI